MNKNESINAPVPGTIFLQPSPDQDSFVNNGDFVKKGDVIALIEIMKSYYEIKSEQEGIFEGFLVNNGDIVHAGQQIAAIKIVESAAKGE